jgi:hypothetical protein
MLEGAPRPTLARSKTWAKIDGVVKVLGLAAFKLKELWIREMSELPVALITAGNSPSMTVETIEAAAQLKLWEQGDESMHELAQLNARYENRRAPGVLKILHEWWDAAHESGGSAWSSANKQAVERSWLAAMSHEQYLEVYARICRAMLEDEGGWDDGEVERLAQEAWQSDTKGATKLSKTGFFDSLFECVPFASDRTRVKAT